MNIFDVNRLRRGHTVLLSYRHDRVIIVIDRVPVNHLVRETGTPDYR